MQASRLNVEWCYKSHGTSGVVIQEEQCFTSSKSTIFESFNPFKLVIKFRNLEWECAFVFVCKMIDFYFLFFCGGIIL
jgi:hypothetical protein